MCVCVCVREREVTGRHSTETQKVLYLRIAKAGRYIRKPTSSTSKGASSRLKGVLLQSVVKTLDWAFPLIKDSPPRKTINYFLVVLSM